MKKRIWIPVLCISVLAVLIVALSITLARYTDTFSDGAQAIEPAPFYFETNLTVDETYYVAVGTDFNFFARNHDTLSHVTGQDIAFDVKINGTTVGNYTCTANVAEDKQIILSASQLGAVGTVKQVTLTSSEPYVKAFSFNVQVVDATATNCYSVKDMGDYVRLDICVGNALPATDIIVQYTGLAPDSTNDLTAGWTLEGGTGAISAASLLPYARYTFYFFGAKSVSEQTNVALGNVITLE